MKERILTGWTFTRVFFMAIGALVITQSVLQQQWLGILPGAYFISMGLFAFGCAAGNCVINSSYKQPVKQKNPQTQEIVSEEVKSN